MKRFIVIALVLSCFVFGMSRKTTYRVQVNQKALNFTLKTIYNKEVSLKDFQNKKVVLVVFFATWCAPCRAEVPHLIKLHEELQGKDFKILAVNFKESTKTIESFIEKQGIKYTVLMDDGKVAQSYGVVGIPTNILVDKNGNIKYNENAMPEKSLIESLLDLK